MTAALSGFGAKLILLDFQLDFVNLEEGTRSGLLPLAQIIIP
jgi:hypothetical protein